MSREIRHYGYDTSLEVEYPFSMFLGGYAICSDGKVRKIKWISHTADTFFSVPATLNVNGWTVSGYVTVECASGSSVETPGDPAVVKFVAYHQGKNAMMLPDGAWKSEPAIEKMEVK